MSWIILMRDSLRTSISATACVDLIKAQDHNFDSKCAEWLDMTEGYHPDCGHGQICQDAHAMSTVTTEILCMTGSNTMKETFTKRW